MNKANLLFPVIVPRSYFQYGNWPGPYRLLKHPKLGLVWVTLENEQAMLYLNHADASAFEASGVDYHLRAMANLHQASAEWAGTHQKRSSEGSLEYIVMMQPDGLGSSRLLLLERIRSVFPDGYNLAIPERSVGIAVSSRLTGLPLQKVQDLIRECSAHGTVPMLDGLYDPEDFTFA